MSTFFSSVGLVAICTNGIHHLNGLGTYLRNYQSDTYYIVLRSVCVALSTSFTYFILLQKGFSHFMMLNVRVDARMYGNMRQYSVTRLLLQYILQLHFVVDNFHIVREKKKFILSLFFGNWSPIVCVSYLRKCNKLMDGKARYMGEWSIAIRWFLSLIWIFYSWDEI